MLVRNRGFTVIELMIVVAIIAVLAAIAAPSFREIMARNRIKTVATDLQIALLRARSEAIKRNADMTVSANGGDWRAGWTTSGGVDVHGAVAGEVEIAANAASVTYRPSGRVSASLAVSVTSPATTTSRCVTMMLSGQPIVNDSACP